MLRTYALATASLLLIATAIGVGRVDAGPMSSPSTGHVTGDWDIDTNTMNAAPAAAPTLGSEFFRVEWSAQPDGQGHTRLTGYVYDDYGQPATDVQLRISLIDPATGLPESSVIRPVRGMVPAKDRAYFDVTVPTNPTYLVGVASFSFLTGGKSS